MKKAVIWDLDGTLFDSYGVIVESLCLTLQEQGIIIPMEEIHHYAIAFSIRSLFDKVSKERGVPAEGLQQRYSQISGNKYLDIQPMPNAIETLSALNERGIENYVFTHRGKTTTPVLENLKMCSFFKAVITSQSGFARKPDPEAILYLLEKYDLDPDNTYYVGDRSIDMACAVNAGITGILYLPERSIDVSGGGETYIVQDLKDILAFLA